MGAGAGSRRGAGCFGAGCGVAATGAGLGAAGVVIAGRGTVGQLQQTGGSALDELVALHHFFFTGGDSPVATRQIPEAARRAAIVAPAASPA